MHYTCIVKQLAHSKIEKNIDALIERSKFLHDAKHHKNNYWCWAHWESWAAQGQDGGCSCCRNGHYNATLKNKRHNKNRTKKTWQDRKEIVSKMCSECVKILETKLGVEFKRNYAP